MQCFFYTKSSFKFLRNYLLKRVYRFEDNNKDIYFNGYEETYILLFVNYKEFTNIVIELGQYNMKI